MPWCMYIRFVPFSRRSPFSRGLPTHKLKFFANEPGSGMWLWAVIEFASVEMLWIFFVSFATRKIEIYIHIYRRHGDDLYSLCIVPPCAMFTTFSLRVRAIILFCEWLCWAWKVIVLCCDIFMTAIKCYADAACTRLELKNYETIMRMTRCTAFVAIRFEFFSFPIRKFMPKNRYSFVWPFCVSRHDSLRFAQNFTNCTERPSNQRGSSEFVAFGVIDEESIVVGLESNGIRCTNWFINCNRKRVIHGAVRAAAHGDRYQWVVPQIREIVVTDCTNCHSVCHSHRAQWRWTNEPNLNAPFRLTESVLFYVLIN